MKPSTVHLDHLDGFEFEELCKDILMRSGYTRVEKTPPVGDEGKDLIIHDTYGKIFVECKHHPNSSIGRPVVQKLHSALITGGAAQGWIITTGSFSKQAMNYTVNLSPPIRLVDRKMLFDMAARAGMILTIGGDRGVQYSYPIVADNVFAGNLGRYLQTFLVSYPRQANEALVLRRRSIKLKPLYSLSYRVNANFRTSIGLIHSERASGQMMIEGTTGLPLDADLQRYYSGAPLEQMSTEGHQDIVVQGYRYVLDIVRDSAINQIISNHTRTVSYVGGNNQTYKKECKPLKKDIFLTDASQIFYPENHIEFDLAGKRRFIDLCDKGSWDFYIWGDDLHGCDICGKPAPHRALLCNECGNICHEPGIFSKHSFYCKQCNKTVCRTCASYFTKFLFFKVSLCQECSAQKGATGTVMKKYLPV